MIEKVFHTWKGLTGLSAVAVLLVVSFGIGDPLTALAQVSTDPVLAPTMCLLPDGTQGKLMHLDKIIFAPVFVLAHATDPLMIPTFAYDIKVFDDPTAMKYANEEVASFLTTAGYVRTNGATITPFNIVVFDIEYEILCEPLPSG